MKYPSSLGKGNTQEADIVRRLFAGRHIDDCPTYFLSLDPDLIMIFDFESLRVGRKPIRKYVVANPQLRHVLDWHIHNSEEFSVEEVKQLEEWYLGKLNSRATQV